MKSYRIPNTPLEVSRIAFGCMRLSENVSEALASIQAALEAGINFFDHADIYGQGRREEVFSAIWREIPGLRERVVLQSKCGIRHAGEPDGRAPKRYDFSRAHIVAAVEGSLRRLRTDHLDILLLHRPDALVEPEEVARAFDDLQMSGKVRFFGVSNHTAAQIQLLQRWVKQTLVINQVEFSLLHTHLLDEGIIFNRSDWPQPLRNEGTLEFCRLHEITLQAWSPLARGALSRAVQDERVARTARLVESLAAEKGVSAEAILIAWILRHPAQIQPIIGTVNPARIRAACQADAVELTREEWYNLFIAGRGAELP